ncbi:hypothetical protein ISS21_01460 [Patescibacteria group bacterium]|nr:hypothetical protein [Patescibacteria group bacterium]
MRIKTNYLQFRKVLQNTGKTYFNFYDLKKFYPYSRENLKILLSNWVKKKWIHHLRKGFYAFDVVNLDYLRLANDMDKNSYISFEYALYFYNLIDQVPGTITSATKKRSRRESIVHWNFEYTHLKDDLFFGYELKNGVYIAIPEKALVDLIYLISRGKRIAELDTLEKQKINQRNLQRILEKFPSYTQKLAQKLKL